MKVETFCTILIYSLLNFMAFLLSVSFLVSVENTNDDDNITAISVLFSFFFICFFIFLVSLMIIIKHDKFDKEKLNDNIAPNTEENKENKENVNPPNQEGNIIVNINEEEQKTDDRLIFLGFSKGKKLRNLFDKFNKSDYNYFPYALI
jgi:hypothetical protein